MSCRCGQRGRWRQRWAQQHCRRWCRHMLRWRCTANSIGQQQLVCQRHAKGRARGSGCRGLQQPPLTAQQSLAASLSNRPAMDSAAWVASYSLVVPHAPNVALAPSATPQVAPDAYCTQQHRQAHVRCTAHNGARIQQGCSSKACQPRTLQHLASASASWLPVMLVALLVLPYSLPAAHTPKLGPGVPSPSISPQVAPAAAYCRWGQQGSGRNSMHDANSWHAATRQPCQVLMRTNHHGLPMLALTLQQVEAATSSVVPLMRRFLIHESASSYVWPVPHAEKSAPRPSTLVHVAFTGYCVWERWGVAGGGCSVSAGSGAEVCRVWHLKTLAHSPGSTC